MRNVGDYTKKMGIVDDYLCAICDDGGVMIRCDGECGRLFHPNSTLGQESSCRGLELTDDQWKLKSFKFICKNCEYKKHQCFVCGELGSSEMPPGSPEEVLKCWKKYYGRFYHPKCLLNYDPSKKHRVFECPLHECHSCKNEGGTIRTSEQIQKEETYLMQCRRCPMAYHRKCLPRDISNVAEGEVERTFNIGKPRGPRRVQKRDPRWFFYCRKHEMVGELNSATRDHLKFAKSSAVFKFNLNEKLREEIAPEANASTSSTGMESSASRPSVPCPQPEGYGGWLED